MRAATGRQQRLDGRRRRSELSRDAIVDAILSLLRERELRPGAEAIAARAGVSLRSVFRHFADLEGLFAAAVEHQRQRLAPLFELDAPTGSLRKRAEAVADQRAHLYEEIAPIRRAAIRQAPFHPAVRKGLDLAAAALRRHIPTVFSAELRQLSTADRRDLIDALDAASSWAFWEVLRNDQRLSIHKASQIVATTLTALVESARRQS